MAVALAGVIAACCYSRFNTHFHLRAAHKSYSFQRLFVRENAYGCVLGVSTSGLKLRVYDHVTYSRLIISQDVTK